MNPTCKKPKEHAVARQQCILPSAASPPGRDGQYGVQAGERVYQQPVVLVYRGQVAGVEKYFIRLETKPGAACRILLRDN